MVCVEVCVHVDNPVVHVAEHHAGRVGAGGSRTVACVFELGEAFVAGQCSDVETGDACFEPFEPCL